MTVVLDLPPEVEARMNEAAEAEGLDISTYLREAAEARLRQYNPGRSLSDVELLERINRGFPEAFWNRFRTLVAQSKAGPLTPEEHQELLAHTDRTESRDAERLTYLIELSKRRGITVQTLLSELGLHPVSLE